MFHLWKQVKQCQHYSKLVINARTYTSKLSGGKYQSTRETIYDIVKEDDGSVNLHNVSKDLKKLGILPDDPRISDFMTARRENGGIYNKEEFKKIISSNRSVYERAFSKSHIIHDFENFSGTMSDIFEECKGVTDGDPAAYIPQLAKQNPEHFGLSVCTVDGQRVKFGEADQEFCIQSCSKPISYCLALEEHGKHKVHQHVGREPSGIRFNALQLNDKGLPHNPLINSGAIVTCSLIQGHLNAADRFDYVQDVWKKLSGGKALGYSNPVYLSERATGDRNFALAYFMRESGAFPTSVTDIVDVLEFYFQCCSMFVTSDMLSIVAATLANGGVCPLTGVQVFRPATVKNCLSMMYSCGMYDYSGEFAFSIGLPAKSGVAGGIFTIIPNVMGICTYSPNLDSYGNSVRGVEFCRKLVKRFNFHLFDNVENSPKENPMKKKKTKPETIEDMIEYASLGDLSGLKRLKLKLKDLNQGDYDKRTPLHLAASNGHLHIVKYLCESGEGLSVNPVDRWNGTPLDDALREGHRDIAEYLSSIGGIKGVVIERESGFSESEFCCSKVGIEN